MATLNTETTQQDQAQQGRAGTGLQARRGQQPAAQQAAQQAAPAAIPPVDVYENEAEFVLLLDLPDVAPGGVDLNVDDRQLTLSATQSTKERGGFRPRTFRRSFQLPDTVDLDQIDAQLDSGVLRVRLRKREDNRPRRVQIQGG